MPVQQVAVKDGSIVALQQLPPLANGFLAQHVRETAVAEVFIERTHQPSPGRRVERSFRVADTAQAKHFAEGERQHGEISIPSPQLAGDLPAQQPRVAARNDDAVLPLVMKGPQHPAVLRQLLDLVEEEVPGSPSRQLMERSQQPVDITRGHLR